VEKMMFAALFFPKPKSQISSVQLYPHNLNHTEVGGGLFLFIFNHRLGMTILISHLPVSPQTNRTLIYRHSTNQCLRVANDLGRHENINRPSGLTELVSSGASESRGLEKPGSLNQW
jgi:hypothetical protein